MAKCRGPSGLPGVFCGKPVQGRGLCAAHYQQRIRHPLEELKPIGATTVGKSKQVTFLVEITDARTIIAEAKRRGVPDAALYREGVHALAEKLRGKK